MLTYNVVILSLFLDFLLNSIFLILWESHYLIVEILCYFSLIFKRLFPHHCSAFLVLRSNLGLCAYQTRFITELHPQIFTDFFFPLVVLGTEWRAFTLVYISSPSMLFILRYGLAKLINSLDWVWVVSMCHFKIF